MILAVLEMHMESSLRSDHSDHSNHSNNSRIVIGEYSAQGLIECGGCMLSGWRSYLILILILNLILSLILIS